MTLYLYVLFGNNIWLCSLFFEHLKSALMCMHTPFIIVACLIRTQICFDLSAGHYLFPAKASFVVTIWLMMCVYFVCNIPGFSSSMFIKYSTMKYSYMDRASGIVDPVFRGLDISQVTCN